MTKNIKFGFCNMRSLTPRMGAVSRFVRNKKLDIFCLVETWLKPGEGFISVNGTYAVVDMRQEKIGKSGAREGILILAKHSMRPAIKVIKKSESSRWCLIKVEEYYVVCCYFSPSTADTEISEMFQFIFENNEVMDLERLLFVGDFNARMKDITGDHSNNIRGPWFIKNILEQYNLVVNETTEGKWTTMTGNGRGITDLVLKHRDSTCVIEDLRVHEECDMDGSDHRPLTWSLVVHKEYPLPAIERWNISRLRQPCYREKLSEVFHRSFHDTFAEMIALYQRAQMPDHDAGEVVNLMYDLFTKWVHQACEVSIGKAYFDVGSSRLAECDEVERARQIVQMLSGKAAKADSSVYKGVYAEYIKASGYYKEIHRNSTQKIEDKWVEEMAKPGKRVQFIKSVNAKRKRESRSMCQLDTEKMDTYVEHFETTFGAKAKGKRVQQRAKKLSKGSDLVDLSAEKIAKALDGLKNGKASGPDDLSAEIVKHENGLAGQLLSLIYKICYQFAVIPDMWSKANVALVYKNKGDIEDIANYRPISLTCVLRRMYERIITEYMTPFAEDKLHPSQGGFRPERNTVHQCYALHEIMQQHPDAFHAFLDLRAAYDCVNRNILWNDLEEKFGMDAHMISICQSLFDANVSNLVINGQKSPDIKCKRGLLQGSSLSPLLFNFYINSLLERLDNYPKLRTNNLESNCLFFADDGALHASNADNLQEQLDECSEWGLEYGMEFAAQKCAVMGKGKREKAFKIQRGIIPVVDSFIYLGIECRVDGMRFDTKHKERIASMMSMAHYLKSKGMHAFGWKAVNSIAAFKVFLRPKIEYGCPLMSKKDKAVENMEQAKNKILNMILSCGKSTSVGAQQKIIQIESMGARVEKLQFRFFYRLNNGGVTDAPAAVIWHSIENLWDISRSALQREVFANNIIDYASNNTSQEVKKYIHRRKFASMEVHDKVDKDGLRNVAASINTPKRNEISILIDPNIERSSQTLVTYMRLGVYTFHQRCKKCGEETSRAHAYHCSGELERLVRLFPQVYDRYTSSVESRNTLFPDFLLNWMDAIYLNDDVKDKKEALAVLTEVAVSASNIRSNISGYVQSEEGNKGWYHPLKSKKKFMFIHHACNPKRKESNHRAYEKRKEKRKRMGEQLRERMSASNRQPVLPVQQTTGEIGPADAITSIDLSSPSDGGYDQYDPP